MNISCFKRGKRIYTARNRWRKQRICANDEKYFTYDDSNMQGNDNYYTNDKSKFTDSVCFAGREIYLNKVMILVAISNSGIFKPLFRPAK